MKRIKQQCNTLLLGLVAVVLGLSSCIHDDLSDCPTCDNSKFVVVTKSTDAYTALSQAANAVIYITDDSMRFIETREVEFGVNEEISYADHDEVVVWAIALLPGLKESLPVYAQGDLLDSKCMQMLPYAVEGFEPLESLRAQQDMLINKKRIKLNEPTATPHSVELKQVACGYQVYTRGLDLAPDAVLDYYIGGAASTHSLSKGTFGGDNVGLMPVTTVEAGVVSSEVGYIAPNSSEKCDLDLSLYLNKRSLFAISDIPLKEGEVTRIDIDFDDEGSMYHTIVININGAYWKTLQIGVDF